MHQGEPPTQPVLLWRDPQTLPAGDRKGALRGAEFLAQLRQIERFSVVGAADGVLEPFDDRRVTSLGA